jgi:[FeFe] hydrogenase H-cluster maturation GTPase HydF
MKKHILLIGETNAGKSSLFNALLGQPRAIVSDQAGTTTDPVLKAMELLPYGPVTLVDTAGLFDESALGGLRGKKTRNWLRNADLVLYVIDPSQYDPGRFMEVAETLGQHKLPFLIVYMKMDIYKTEGLPTGYNVSIYDSASIENVKKAMVNALVTHTVEERLLLDGLVPTGGVVVLVVPIDEAAPAGRLILPQSQLIRACLDQQLRCHVTLPEQLPEVLQEVTRIDLVVTDSQAFAQVNEILPPDIPLTSFSILMARQKGDFLKLLDEVRAIKALKPGDRVLIAEACTHTSSHEDIGQVKIPHALNKITGGDLKIDFIAGKEFPDDVSAYTIVVHCGGCMITPKMFAARQALAAEAGVPFTNYGIVLAHAAGVLERAIAFP